LFNLGSDIAEAFRLTGLRRTPQRHAVLKYLMRSVHATPDEIFRAINRAYPRASRATVYNNLHALVAAGIIREVAVEGKAVYDANIERHHHFVCERCGRVEDIAWFDLPPLGLRSPLGTRVVRNYQVVFRGICQHCPKTTTEEKEDGKSSQTGCRTGGRQRRRPA
jgi:Fe2+ or Zn2+ uptake regulation protein